MELRDDYDDTDQTMDVGTAPIRPYELNAWAVCPRKCWLLQRHLMMEAHSPYVELGRMLHHESQERAQREPDALTDIPIEDIARLDKLAGELVYEVKHSPRMHAAHRLQLLYYLHLLRERGLTVKGVLHYPKQRRREIVELDAAGEAELQRALAAVQRLREQPLPPTVERPMSICRHCAYQELCWCEEETP
jgi:CRISPR-associated exonuclease Cas4